MEAYPLGPVETMDPALLSEKLTGAAIVALTITARPTMAPLDTASPEEEATRAQEFRAMADITLAGNGKTYTFTYGRRFFVFLDDERYPLADLRCEPDWVMGWVSNGSFRGPTRYPVYYEATRVGRCRLVNGDFWAEIIVVEPTPELTPIP